MSPFPLSHSAPGVSNVTVQHAEPHPYRKILLYLFGYHIPGNAIRRNYHVNTHCISRFGQAYDIFERGSLFTFVVIIHKIGILIYEHHYLRILSPRISCQS